MSQFITWAEFKERVEAAAVKVEGKDLIAEINIRGNMNFTVTRDPRDMSVTVTTPGVRSR